MMRDFSEIFARHFFSNHHTEAKQLESRLEALWPGHECVTFSSFPALLIAAIDELYDANTNLYVISESDSMVLQIASLNRFLHETGRRQLIIAESDKYPYLLEQVKYGFDNEGISPKALLMENETIKGVFLDLSTKIPMLFSSGVFVTKDADLAEKIRWSRSSYGRRKSASINIAANGRFSEFQAYLINHTKNISHEVLG